MTTAEPVEQEKIVPVSSIEAVLVIAVTFFSVMLIGGLLDIALGTAWALVLSELIILIAPLVYLLAKDVNIKRYIGLDVNPELVMWGFVSGAVLLVVNIAVTLVLVNVFGESQAVIDSNIRIMELASTPEGLIAVATTLSLAGVCEEFAFRAFLQNTLTRRFSFIPALLLSAFAFGIFHFDPELVYILSAFAGGIVLGYIYHRWNSYIVAVIAHSSVNLIVLVFLMLGI